MAEMQTKQVTKSGRCPTHGTVQAVKEVPVFTPPGLFWVFRYIGSMTEPYRCPECGTQVESA